jgi:hypothetical protein
MIPENTTPPVANGLLEKIKNFLFTEYEPVQATQVTASTMFLSTQEIFTKLQDIYPCADYSSSDVANWLHEKGFSFTDNGVLRLEWMLQPSANM